MTLTLQVLSAFILDIILGDPRNYPHPVKIIARLAIACERSTRKFVRSEKFAGLVTVFLVVLISFATVYYIISFLRYLHPIAGFAGSVFFIYASLSIRSLFDESLLVTQFLKEEKLQEARTSLSSIVGRDTQNLNEEGIVRATVETIAESTVDGIIAPLFFAIFGGAPLVITYKAISTMDSLFGYKNKKYIDFGWAAARLDDLANWIPARLAIPIIAMGAALCGGNGRKACSIGYRDGNKHPSPNAGIPEATMAGALGIQLGGISYYSGVENEKPVLGDSSKGLNIPDIEQSHKIMFASSCIALAFVLILCQLKNYFGIII